jgi:hypothetical protein
VAYIIKKKLYKIQHKPTGLFYKPSKYGSKNNLSKNGKVYHVTPNIALWLKHGSSYWYQVYEKDAKGLTRLVKKDTKLEDWEIVCYEIG